MDRLHVVGQQKPLSGSVAIEGAKNALLLQMAAALLTEEPLILEGVPPLADTKSMILLLECLGAQVSPSKTFLSSGSEKDNVKRLKIQAKDIQTYTAPYHIVRKMRASILALGPLLARYGKAKVSLPGGCAIGIRPIDLHLKGLEALGATLNLEDGYVHATASKGLKGTTYAFPKVTVTGTANLLTAATLAKGETVLENAALEPEIADLAHCLNKMGANIEGIGSSCLRIQGVQRLSGAVHQTLPDRIETGTYLLAAAITGSELFLQHTRLDLLPTLTSFLRQMGVVLEQEKRGGVDGIYIKSPSPKDMQGVNFETAPYPGFPTDLQAQMMALLTLVPGVHRITETIFENRFMHVAELHRMGAKIDISHHTATVQGVSHLKGAPLMATDIRASACLVLAALVAKGESTVQRIYHLDRGYHHLHQKLQACGATITRIAGDTNNAAAVPSARA